MDFSAIRSRLAGSEGRLYWRSLGELADTPEFREYLHREFPEQASEWNDPKGRREFLKLMSASLALAGVGACTKQPPEEIVPYVTQPEELVPGRPLFFASAIPFDGVAHPVLVESHMGRPTKIEGNPEHPASLGATDAITQGEILNLYDPDRAKTITYRGEVRPWGAFVTAMENALAAQQERAGADIRILTGPITSPSLAELLATFLDKYPQAKWHQADPIPSDGAREGIRQASGTVQDAIYHFDQADIVVSLDSDFLNSGHGHVRYARDFADRRRVTDDRKEMNRLYAIESTPTLTGAKADHRLVVRALEIEGVARQLAAALGAGTPSNPANPEPRPTNPEPRPANPEPRPANPEPRPANPEPRTPNPDEPKFVAAAAKDLQAHRGKCLVVAGEYQPAAVHALAYEMNRALGNIGTTVTFAPAIHVMPADARAGSLAELVKAMDATQVGLLIILGGNPVYTAPADLRFGERLQKVGLAVYHGLYADETAYLCHWHVPDTHPLETWGDSRAYDGTVTLTQPLIAPLYEGRSVHEVLGVFAKQPGRARALVKNYWTRAFAGGAGWTIHDRNGQPYSGAETFWKHALHDGFIAGTATSEGGPATPFVAAGAETGAAAAIPGATAGSAAAARPAGAPQAAAPARQTPSNAPATATGLEIIFRPDPNVWDGRFANNGWLQELPKPLTKIAWDTTAWISPKLAEDKGLSNGDVIELRYRGNTARMPIFIVPGHPQQSVTVFFGYGRTMAGRVGNATGIARQFNAFLLRTSDAPWFGTGLEIAKTGDRYLLATTQQQQLMEGRAPVRVASLEQYAKEPGIIHEMGEKPPRTLTLYPEHEYNGYKWGMAIDLAACTGCGACTIACVAENNIPVVGKEQVSAGRVMHWIRVDHYFSGPDLENPEAYHQPVPCMQCENAPCELVCPVAATSHSSEGLNDMVYNRCVGTRYCSNNCPYKVRRFNFLLYQDWDTPQFYPLRNPDVTVRSRGVMEKCTYCVQRISQARIDAKRDDRRIADGEVVTACQAVCPAEAIVFGDMNDPKSKVNQLKAQERNYGVLEDLNTRPRTTYLAALRNPNPELEPARDTARQATEH